MRPVKRSSVVFSNGVRVGAGRGVAGGTGLVKAIHLLSGLKIGAPSTPGMRNASPPAASMRRNHTESVTGPPGSTAARREVNASSRPSGLHRGADDVLAWLVRRRGGAEPSAGTIRISLWRRFSASTMNVRTNATLRPSGDTAVSLMDSTR